MINNIIVFSRSQDDIVDAKVQINLRMASIGCILQCRYNGHGTTKMVLGDVENFYFFQKGDFISNCLFSLKANGKSGESGVKYLNNELF